MNDYRKVLNWVANRKDVEFKNRDGYWQTAVGNDVITLIANDNYTSEMFRLKSEHVAINGLMVPPVMREAPEKLSPYWTASLASDDFVEKHTWAGDMHDYRWLNRGLCHDTLYGAQQHAMALLSFTKP